MYKIHKKGALTNFLLITNSKSEYELVNDISVIYIEADTIRDLVEGLREVLLQIEQINHLINEESITIVTTMDTYIFKLLECSSHIFHLSKENLDAYRTLQCKHYFFSKIN